MAAEAFAVVREGMAGKAGIGKVALYGREYLVAIRPQKKGLVMYTLHHDAEIRSIDRIEELGSVPSKVKPEEMKLAKQIIATFDAELNLKDYKDEYTEGLRQIIDAKIAGEEIVASEVADPPKVVDLMEALRRSLDSVSTTKKKSAKAALSVARKSKVKGRRSPFSQEGRHRLIVAAARCAHVAPRNRLSSSDAHTLPTIGPRFALTLTTVSLRTCAHLAAGRRGGWVVDYARCRLKIHRPCESVQRCTAGVTARLRAVLRRAFGHRRNAQSA